MSFVTRSLSSDTRWLPISGHTRGRNLSSVHTVIMLQASKVKLDSLVNLLKHKSQTILFVNHSCNDIKWRFQLDLVTRYLPYFAPFKANLNVHLRKHTGEKFSCQHCPFKCLSPGHLKVVLSLLVSFFSLYNLWVLRSYCIWVVFADEGPHTACPSEGEAALQLLW